MKNSKNKLIVAMALILVGGLYLLNGQKKSDTAVESNGAPTGSTEGVASKVETAKEAEANLPKNTAPLAPIAPVVQDSDLASFNDLTAEEKKSLITLSYLLHEAIAEDATMDVFVKRLDDLKLKPKVLVDSNKYSGDMNVVRTEGTLPGTRYINAQYFGKAGQITAPQNISFELRPSKASFEAAKAVFKGEFKLGKPTNETKNFISWSIPGRVVWVKTLEKDDLHHPMNSYNPNTDVGTVRIGIDEEIH